MFGGTCPPHPLHFLVYTRSPCGWLGVLLRALLPGCLERAGHHTRPTVRRPSGCGSRVRVQQRMRGSHRSSSCLWSKRHVACTSLLMLLVQLAPCVPAQMRAHFVRSASRGSQLHPTINKATNGRRVNLRSFVRFEVEGAPRCVQVSHRPLARRSCKGDFRRPLVEHVPAEHEPMLCVCRCRHASSTAHIAVFALLQLTCLHIHQ